MLVFTLQSGILCIAKLGGEMRDLDKALADIFAIRSQIAAGTAFRGYGPATVAATGGFALLTALLQIFWLYRSTRHSRVFFFRRAAAPLPFRGLTCGSNSAALVHATYWTFR